MRTTMYVLSAVAAFLLCILFNAAAKKRRKGRVVYQTQVGSDKQVPVKLKSRKSPIVPTIAAVMAFAVGIGSILAASGNLSISDILSVHAEGGETGDDSEQQAEGGAIGEALSNLENKLNSLTVSTDPQAIDPTDEPEIPNVMNIEWSILEMKYADVSRYYLWMADQSTMAYRNRITGLGDAFALPLGFDEQWLFYGTIMERNNTPLAQLNGKLGTEPDWDYVEKQWKLRQEEMAKMSPEELEEFLNEDERQRFLRSPQYWASFAEVGRISPVVMKNNAMAIELFYQRLAEYNGLDLSDFSADLQSKFTEESFKAFTDEILHELTDEEVKAIEAGGDIFPNIENRELLGQFLDELGAMPFGIDLWLQYDPEHPNDIRYTQVTEEGRKIAIYFYEIWIAMPQYGLSVMTTIHNWIQPVLSVYNRQLKVREADYQENVPDKNGKIQHQYEGHWRWFPIKNSLKTNQIFAGTNGTDGRLMLAAPTVEPIVPPKTQPGTPDNPNPGKPNDPDNPPDQPNPETPDYKLDLRCIVEGTNEQLSYNTLGRYPENAVVPITAPTHPGYTLVTTGKTSHKMPAHDDVVTLTYRKNGTPPPTNPLYMLDVHCIDSANGQEISGYGWTVTNLKAGAAVGITPPSIPGYVAQSSAFTHTMPASNDTIYLYYSRDGQGAKNPEVDPENKPETDHGRGNNDDDSVVDSSDPVDSEDESANDTDYSEENEKREQEQQKQQQDQDDAAEQKENDVTQGAEAAKDDAKDKGQGDGVNVEGNTNPDDNDTDLSGAEGITGTVGESSEDSSGNTTNVVTDVEVSDNQEVPGGEEGAGDDGYFQEPQ